MDKKFYEMPESEVILLQMNSAILVGSNDLDDVDEETGEAPKSDIVI
jgi:hypothetical protein